MEFSIQHAHYIQNFSFFHNIYISSLDNLNIFSTKNEKKVSPRTANLNNIKTFQLETFAHSTKIGSGIEWFSTVIYTNIEFNI